MTWWDPRQYTAILPTAGLYHAGRMALFTAPPALNSFERGG